MSIIYAYAQDDRDDGLAKELAECLYEAFPGHSWWVEIKGGVVIVKHFRISGTIGMVRHLSKLSHDAMVRKRDVIMAAGELLERAHLRRGAYDGAPVRVLEGAEGMKWQPRRDVDTFIHTLDGTIH